MRPPSPRKIDIVVPVRNAEPSISVFVDAMNRLAMPESVRIGIVFVEDSSTDNTLKKLREVAASVQNVSYFSLAKGFGEGPAVVFGMSKSTAEAVITMEVGGGHPVDMVVELVSHYLDGADIVQAVRRSLKNRKLYRSVGTEVFNVLLRLLTGFDLKVQNVYFRLLSRRQKDLLILDHRFFTSLRFRLPDVRACRVDRVYFDAEDRTGAESTYTFLRLVNLSFHIVLSLISVARLSILLLFGLALAVLIGAWPCIVFVIGFAAVALRACKLWNGRTIAMMDPKEAHVATE